MGLIWIVQRIQMSRVLVTRQPYWTRPGCPATPRTHPRPLRSGGRASPGPSGQAVCYRSLLDKTQTAMVSDASILSHTSTLCSCWFEHVLSSSSSSHTDYRSALSERSPLGIGQEERRLLPTAEPAKPKKVLIAKTTTKIKRKNNNNLQTCLSVNAYILAQGDVFLFKFDFTGLQ